MQSRCASKSIVQVKSVYCYFLQKYKISTPLTFGVSCEQYTLFQRMADQVYVDYNKAEAFTLLFVQIFFILVMFAFLVYWHVKHPDSLAVTKEYEKQLLERNEPQTQNQQNQRP